MELTDMSLDQIERYQADLRHLHADLVGHAAAGRFRQAGKTFTRLLQLQHAYGMLPGRAESDAVRAELAELDRVPGWILGIH